MLSPEWLGCSQAKVIDVALDSTARKLEGWLGTPCCVFTCRPCNIKESIYETTALVIKALISSYFPNKIGIPIMKVKRLENSYNQRGSMGCRWSNFKAFGPSFLESRVIYGWFHWNLNMIDFQRVFVAEKGRLTFRIVSHLLKGLGMKIVLFRQTRSNIHSIFVISDTVYVV